MSTSSDVYSEEPYALIGHVRFCEGEVRAQNGAHPLYSTKPFQFSDKRRVEGSAV